MHSLNMIHALSKFLERSKTHWPVTFTVFFCLLLFIPLFQGRNPSEIFASPFLFLSFLYVLHAYCFYFLPLFLKKYSFSAEVLKKWNTEALTCILGVCVIPITPFFYVFLLSPLYGSNSIAVLVVTLHLGLFSCWIFYRGVLYFYNKKSFNGLSILFNVLLGGAAIYPIFLIVGSVLLNEHP